MYVPVQNISNIYLNQFGILYFVAIFNRLFSHHLNPVSATVHKVHQSQSDSRVVDNNVSALQHYVETELRLLAQCGDAKYKVRYDRLILLVVL